MLHLRCVSPGRPAAGGHRLRARGSGPLARPAGAAPRDGHLGAELRLWPGRPDATVNWRAAAGSVIGALHPQRRRGRRRRHRPTIPGGAGAARPAGDGDASGLGHVGDLVRGHLLAPSALERAPARVVRRGRRADSRASPSASSTSDAIVAEGDDRPPAGQRRSGDRRLLRQSRVQCRSVLGRRLVQYRRPRRGARGPTDHHRPLEGRHHRQRRQLPQPRDRGRGRGRRRRRTVVHRGVRGPAGAATPTASACSSARRPTGWTSSTVCPGDSASTLVERMGLQPDYLVPVEKDGIPKTAIGKIQRAQLKTRFEAGEFDEVVKRVDVATGNSADASRLVLRAHLGRRGPAARGRGGRGRYLVLRRSVGLGRGGA